MTTCYVCGKVGDDEKVDPDTMRCLKRKGCAGRMKVGGWGAQTALRLSREKDRPNRRLAR